MAGPIIPAMPQATALVLGIPYVLAMLAKLSGCWNVTAADWWRPYTCTRLQLPSPCPTARCRCHRRCGHQGRRRGYPRD